ncbi:MAG: ATP-grasp domain-containing protein [Chloroflexota bacterium]|nr:ATP-grasp domain-containing protein [Chloroflexota bacterium]
MRIIFCSDYWNRTIPDAAYEAEAEAARRLRLNYSLINIEALIEQQNAARAVRNVDPAATEEVAVYRGWMLKPDAYERLYTALAGKGLLLINTPAAYMHCHYLPESYHLLAGVTPRSAWLKTGPVVSMDEVMTALQQFGDRPVIVKDFVKSQKHEWYEACYIPSATDRQAVERVVTRFLELQGADLNEGLVFREFLEFEPLTTHSKSGMPLIREFRLFVLDGQIILATPYWEEGDYGNDAHTVLPLDDFAQIAQKIQSRFFTLDVARKRDGTWNIVEPGDGQVAGLPARADVEAFYQALGRL